MTIKELLEREGKNVIDYEVYEYTEKGYHDSYPHTDYIRSIDDIEKDWEVKGYYLMDEDEYNESILANSSVSADFDEWYDDKDGKILVIMVEVPVCKIVKTSKEIRYKERFEIKQGCTWKQDDIEEEKVAYYRSIEDARLEIEKLKTTISWDEYHHFYLVEEYSIVDTEGDIWDYSTIKINVEDNHELIETFENLEDAEKFISEYEEKNEDCNTSISF